MAEKPFIAADGKPRCNWCGSAPEFLDYHDNEWGYPVDGDQRLFEKVCLESFQSGLSWRTIYNKRENFRKAFKQFDFNKIAKFSEKEIIVLLQNIIHFIKHRKFEKLQILVLIIIALSGGATILLHDPIFIKLKPRRRRSG